jgi:ankyrin repeat protein
MEWSFRVRLSKVSAKQLNCPERTPHSLPFFRVDFDGKQMQSELCQSTGDPTWQHKSSFEYRLSEDGVQRAIASLCARTCAIEVLFSDVASGREISVGRCVVDLYTVASGAATMTYELARSGSPACGSISFELSMEHQTVTSVLLGGVSINGLPRPAPYKLSYHFLSLEQHEVEGPISSVTQNPQWDVSELPKLLIRSTLRSLLDDTVRVHVRDVQQNGSKIAHFDLPMREFLSSNAAHSASFTKNAYANPGTPANFTALVNGSVAFRDLPVFAQFVSGANNGGHVHGKPLFPSCPPPPNFSKQPQKLPASLSRDPPPPQTSSFSSSSAFSSAQLAGRDMQSLGVTAQQPQIPSQPTATQRYQTQTSTAAVSNSSSSHYYQSQQQQQQHHAAPGTSTTMVQPPPAAYQVAFSPAVSAPPSPRPLPVTPSPYTYSTAAPAVAYSHPPAAVAPMFAAPLAQPYPASPYPTPAAHTSAGHLQYSQAASTSYLAQQAWEGEGGSAAADALNRSRAAGLSTASDQLIRQHHDTVEALAAQQRRVKALHDEIQERTLVEVTNAENRMRELAAEETRVMEDLRRCDARSAEIAKHQEELEANAQHFSASSESEFVALTTEMSDLDDLLAHLMQLQSNISAHVSDDDAIRQRARYELDATRSRLVTDIKDLNMVEQKVTQRLITPSKASSSSSAGVSGIYGQYYTTPASPTRAHAGAGTSAQLSVPPPHLSTASASAQAGGAASIGRWDAEDLMSAVQAGDTNRFLYILSRSPSAIHSSVCDSILHQACAQAAPDFDIVQSIVAARSELTLGVDTVSGNTALHFACAAKVASVEVLDLLLRSGARVDVCNNDGLTPFHIALLNVNDAEQHRIKRFLIFKGSVNINTCTSRGETPAHICATNDRYLESLRFLLQHGGNITASCLVVNSDNRPVSMTALDKARMMGVAADECRRFLERATLGY